MAAYDGTIGAGNEITLFANVYNNGSLPVSQFDVRVFDNDDVLLQTSIINGELPVGEYAEIEIPFTLPPVVSMSDYRIEILPNRGIGFFPSDNKAFFTVGYADLIIENCQEVRTDTGRKLIINIKNQGFSKVSFAELRLLEAEVVVLYLQRWGDLRAYD